MHVHPVPPRLTEASQLQPSRSGPDGQPIESSHLAGDDKAVINEVERGEDFIKAKFMKAADDIELPAPIRQRLSNAYAEVKADHDEVSRIKHQLQ